MIPKENAMIKNIKTREDQIAACKYIKKRTDTITYGLIAFVILLLIASSLPM